MGIADIIPGVSGGSIALITGIYEEVLSAVRSFDAVFLRKLFRGDAAGALEGAHLRFLIVLLSGIAAAIVSLAGLMHFLLKNHPVETYSFFFGLLAASIFIVGKDVAWKPARFAALAAGAVFAYLLVGLVPVATPHDLPFVFLSGVVGICAMILPGISGAFLLLILGKYEFITGTLKSPFSANEMTGVHNLLIIAVFCVGCAAGIAAFSRFLRRLLDRRYDATLAFLTGLMAGSMRRIWPWKGDALVRIIRGREYILSQSNVLPPGTDGAFLPALLLMLTGACLILLLDRFAGKHRK